MFFHFSWPLQRSLIDTTQVYFLYLNPVQMSLNDARMYSFPISPHSHRWSTPIHVYLPMASMHKQHWLTSMCNHGWLCLASWNICCKSNLQPIDWIRTMIQKSDQNSFGWQVSSVIKRQLKQGYGRWGLACLRGRYVSNLLVLGGDALNKSMLNTTTVSTHHNVWSESAWQIIDHRITIHVSLPQPRRNHAIPLRAAKCSRNQVVASDSISHSLLPTETVFLNLTNIMLPKSPIKMCLFTFFIILYQIQIVGRKWIPQAYILERMVRTLMIISAKVCVLMYPMDADWLKLPWLHCVRVLVERLENLRIGCLLNCFTTSRTLSSFLSVQHLKQPEIAISSHHVDAIESDEMQLVWYAPCCACRFETSQGHLLLFISLKQGLQDLSTPVQCYGDQ